MHGTIVVNVANEIGWYLKGQKRLANTLNIYNQGHVLLYSNENLVGAPPHKENPYAFKIYGIQKALEEGYKKILWLDASVYVIRDTKPIWDVIENDGYIMQEAGHFVGTWANDKCLEYFNLDRDEAMEMMMYGNAGFLGLNFNFEICQEFFKQWKESMLAGMFKGAWTNNDGSESEDERCKGHRHDMTCGSIIANRLGMSENYKSGNEWLEYGAPDVAPKNDTIILKAHPA